MVYIILIVIPVNIEQGSPAHGHKEAEIIRFQVTAGQDKVYPVQCARLIVVPKKGALLISYQ